jgi:hypothetical protein
MAIVSTGQFTIVDNNDARPITSFITASGVTQQVYTKDESTVSYVPDWTTSNLTLTAKVYVGGTSSATEVSANLSNRKWSTSFGGTSLGSATTYVVNTNLTEVSPTTTYYFEGDYTDGTTGLVSHVIAQITLNLVKTGTNAVYIQVNGQHVIEQATGSTKNTITVSAALMRAAGVDDSGVTYQWYKSPFSATDQIDGNYTDPQTSSAVTSIYGFQDTAAFNANRVGVVSQYQTTSGTTTAAISTSNVPDASWTDLKALVIHESAVQNIGLYLVKAKDALGTIYQQYFSIYDVSDKYQVIVSSTAGDKLQNGVGSTNLSPVVYYGATQVASLTGWTFTWYFYDRNGYRGAFVDTSKLSGGATITANTTGTTASISCASITANLFAAGDIIKCVKSDGTAYFYEVGAASTAGAVTIRTPSTNTFLNFTNFAAPATTSDFVNGKIFAALATRSSSGANTITLTGDDVDVKSKISIDANRP